LISTVEEDTEFDDGAFQYTPADQWILSLLQTTIEQCHHHFKTYRFDLLANTLYEFIWHEFCDWYLELSKTVLYDDSALPAMKRGTRGTLIHVLSCALKLLHPITPFITEAIWQRMTKITTEYAETIMLSHYPHVEPQFVNPTLEAEFEWIKKIVQSIRTIRSEMGINPSKYIPVLMRYNDPALQQRIDTYQPILMTLSKIATIEHIFDQVEIPVCASAVVGQVELLIPMADLIDKDAELARLNKEIIKLDKDIAFAETKLNNASFTSKAPREIIASIEDKLAQALLAKEKLLQHQAKIILL
jgi:valyl-tRNA synthetase